MKRIEKILLAIVIIQFIALGFVAGYFHVQEKNLMARLDKQFKIQSEFNVVLADAVNVQAKKQHADNLARIKDNIDSLKSNARSFDILFEGNPQLK
jgi:Tfp pilus assembly protein PilO